MWNNENAFSNVFMSLHADFYQSEEDSLVITTKKQLVAITVVRGVESSGVFVVFPYATIGF